MTASTEMTPEHARELLEGATEGPWLAERDRRPGIIEKYGVYAADYTPVVSHFTGIEDAADAEAIATWPSLARSYLAEHEARIAAEASRDAAVAAALREADIGAALDAMEAYMRSQGVTTIAWRTEMPEGDQNHLRACFRAGLSAALIRPEASAALDRMIAEAQKEAYREGWAFAYRQCEATGSVPNPGYSPVQGTGDV